MAASAARTVISWTDHSGSDHHGPRVTRVHDHDVIACEVCGFRHVIPLPDAETRQAFYRALAAAGLGRGAIVVAVKT